MDNDCDRERAYLNIGKFVYKIDLLCLSQCNRTEMHYFIKSLEISKVGTVYCAFCSEGGANKHPLPPEQVSLLMIISSWLER